MEVLSGDDRTQATGVAVGAHHNVAKEGLAGDEMDGGTLWVNVRDIRAIEYLYTLSSNEVNQPCI
jgi:hypothetical protein